MRRQFAFLSILFTVFAAPQAAQAGVDVRVDLSSQTMTVRSPDGGVHRWAISSGRSGYRTPNGVYSSKRLARMHYSRKYDNAPMPHAIFFSGGYAIHGTGAVGLLGRPASHGCIRLAPGNAAKLFAMVRDSGARITIGGSASDGRVYAGKRRLLSQADDDNDAPAPRVKRKMRAYPAFGYGPYWSIDGGGPTRGWILR